MDEERREPFAPMTDQEKSKRTRSTDQDEWTVVLPVPEYAPEPTFCHMDFGEPSHTWEYRNSNGDTLGYVCRFDLKDGKELRPHFFCKQPNGQHAWRWKAPPKPRPLYGLDQLLKKPDAAVLVVEGEKTAEPPTQATTRSGSRPIRSRLCCRASRPITDWKSRTIIGKGCGPTTEPMI